MMKAGLKIFLLAVFSFLLLRTMAGEDSGQYLILHARYGNERNHVDVTARLKELARLDRSFRVDARSMAVDPDPGHSKMLRVFARGPNGQEQSFDFPDGRRFDGAQFRSWRAADWGEEHWVGGWNGRGGGDEGQFVILSAQYGTRHRHVDVTDQLKEMARRDESVRLDFRTFGTDPDRGRPKVLRIYARGPHGHERMFEYLDGSVIDGRMFRAWGRGEWAERDDRWSGKWDMEREERRERDR